MILFNFTANEDRLLFQVPDPTCTLEQWISCDPNANNTQCGGENCTGNCIHLIDNEYICEPLVSETWSRSH